jgi:pullulanase/glycogen debranching enzyme
MTPADWHDSQGRCLLMLLSAPGRPYPDRELLLVANADDEPVTVSLPERPYPGSWLLELDTGAEQYLPQRRLEPASTLALQAKALSLLVYTNSTAQHAGADGL